ncbi:LamG-like jellyroll fold domain-containing protein [Streptosporangium sp. NPDC001559]|uniref:LamG-like jellyroll fold domain-containing protein n=1 Tax=Streptosporangium sp. NPDC001559 TaxID=3366187 RepID=UPI0036ED3B99
MTVSALAASLLVSGGVSPAQAEPKPPAKPAPAEPTFTTFPTPKDPDAALRAGIEAAKKQNKAVEVPEASTETARTWAFPDGHLTTQSYAAPTRVKQADGSWAWIDTTLVERDGVLRPKVAKADMEFSAGGPGQPFASMKRDKGQRFALSWPTALPRPTIAGNVATYPNAAGPEADLVVTVLPTGFRHDVVLRSKPAGPVEFRIPVQTDKLTLARSKQNGLRLSDASGKTVAQAPEPVMTDSAASAGDNAGKGVAKLRLGKIDTRVAVENGKPVLILKPDEKFLNDPATVYPVTVDPTTTLTLQSDVSVRSRSQCGSLGGPGADKLWAGGQSYACGGISALNYYRTFLKFDTAPFLGRAVGSAQLELFAQSGPGCNFNTNGIKVSRVTEAWDPATIDSLAWSSLPAAAESGSQTQLCPDYSAYPTQFSWSIKDIANAWAAGAANHGLQLRGVNESMTWGQNGWVEFHSAERTGSDAHPPRLTVSYMLPPEIPTVEVQSIDSMVDNDAIARSTDVKVVFKSSVAEATPLDYTVSVNDSTMITPPAIPAGDVAYYKFDETSGTTTADSSGHNFTATLNGPVTRGTGQLGQALVFANDQSDGNGNDAYVSTSGPLVHTNTSFSVSSWVKLDGAAGNQTVFSQSGTVQPGFALSYVDSPGNPDINQKWWLGMPANDASATSHTVAISDKPAKVNSWTHVVAVYDATAHKLRLYVDGALAAEKDHTSTWDAGGALQIGRGKIIGIPGFLSGSVDDLHVYDRALAAEEVRAIQGAPTTTSYNGVPSGQAIDKVFALDNPASFKFVVKACRTGVTPPSCNESPAYRITSDAPFLPTDPQTGLWGTELTPILSGMASRPSGGSVTAKFFLYDSTGTPIGSSPLGERIINGGERASFQITESTVQSGQTYTWQMQACALEICTSKTDPIGFTVPGNETQPTDESHTITLLKDNFILKTGKTDPMACDGAPCPLIDTDRIQVGGAGVDQIATVIGLKLNEVPDGATFTEELLNLGSPACQGEVCQPETVITATPLKSGVTGATRGSDLISDLDTARSLAFPIEAPQADLADNAYTWYMLTSNRDELVSFSAPGADEQLSSTIVYFLPGPPSKVLNLVAQAGDSGVTASWGMPVDNGGMVLLDGYDAEVLDGGGQPVKIFKAANPTITIGGLTNGTTYTIRVRARTNFGAGDWESTTFAPKAAPPPPVASSQPCDPNIDIPAQAKSAQLADSVSSVQEYADRIKAYYQAQDAVLEGRAATVWQVPGVTPQAPSTAKLSLLNESLVTQKQEMDAAGVVRSNSTINLSNVVPRDTGNGTVLVTAMVQRNWEQNSTVPAEAMGAAQVEEGNPGQVEPSEASIDVFVFDRCGKVTIIQIPWDSERDSTDSYDAGSCNGGFIEPEEPLQGQPSSTRSVLAGNPGCGTPTYTSCLAKSGEIKTTVDSDIIRCFILDNLGKKGWYYKTWIRSGWKRSEATPQLDKDQIWRIPVYENYVVLDSANAKWGRTSKFGQAMLKFYPKDEDPSKKERGANIQAAGAACFTINRTDTTIGVDLSIGGQRGGEPAYVGGLSFGAQWNQDSAEECGQYNPEAIVGGWRIRDVFSDVKGECISANIDSCEVESYRHALRSSLTISFSYTQKKNGKRVSVPYEWDPIRHTVYVKVKREFDRCKAHCGPFPNNWPPVIVPEEIKIIETHASSTRWCFPDQVL